MRSSPRRPLILKRRRLNLPCEDGARGSLAPEQRPTPLTRAIQQPGQTSAPRTGVTGTHEPNLAGKTAVTATPDPSQDHRPLEPNPCSEAFLSPNQSHDSPAVRAESSAIKIMGHPTIPNTQLVVIPPNSDVESIIQALTARGKESGAPNRFILITGSNSFHAQAEKLGLQSKADDVETLQIEATSSSQHQAGDGDTTENQEAGDIDISLTNIQWLGDMSSDRLGQCDAKTEPEEKENHTPKMDAVKVEEEQEVQLPEWQLSISERPPYSYMALIQFAINSTATKRMTLKDIYTWIEDHFPYFKHVAKPGWKNSIRHNLSLHDMFVRESPSNNKVSYWTIHPQANRWLTLDQVFKATDSSSSSAGSEQQPKRLIPPASRAAPCVSASSKAPERKMKPLLPRIDSYLIPVQFPVSHPVIISPLEFCSNPGPSDAQRSSKRIKIAPKVSMETMEPPQMSLPLPAKTETVSTNLMVSPPFRCSQRGGSRRKQQLVTPRSQDPEIFLPDCSGSDSGLDTDFSFLQDTHTQEGASHLTQDEGYSFKTPIKERFLKPPASSTPSKPADECLLQPWESETPLPRDPLQEFSPVRIPLGSALTPYKDSFGALAFGETPFKDLPCFGSPSDLMTNLSPSSPQRETLGTSPGAQSRPKRCSKELQVGGATNRSLLEGLVLDTADESLSKILLDISFTGLEEDNGLGVDCSYWGQLLSELR